MKAISYISSFDTESRQGLLRFAAKLVAFVCVVAVIDLIGLLFKVPVHPANVEWHRKVDYYHAMLASKNNFDTIAVGSSLTQSGFDPALFDRQFGGSSFNAGIAGRSNVLMAEELIEEVAAKKPKLIIYAIESWSLLEPPPRPNTPQKPQMLHFMNIFQNRTEIRTWIGVLLRGKLSLPPALLPETTMSVRFASYASVKALPNGFVDFRAVAKPGFVPSVSDDFDIVPQQAKALEDIVAFCKRLGIAIVLVQMPEYQEEIDRSAKRQEPFRKYMTAFSAAHHVPYLDFNFDIPFPRGDINNFYDVNHINARGSAVYTEELARQLKNLCPPPSRSCSISP